MSLSYQAEHLAWKQRVVQETTRSNQFYKTFDTLDRTGTFSRTPTSNLPPNPNLLRSNGYIDPRNYEVISPQKLRSHSSLSHQKLNPKLQKLYDEKSYKNANVNLGYSFGGRFHVSKAFKETSTSGDLNSQESNGIITRPSTAKSLVKKTNKHYSRPASRNLEAHLRASSRPLSRESNVSRGRQFNGVKISKPQAEEDSIAKEFIKPKKVVQHLIKENPKVDDVEAKDKALDIEERPESPNKEHNREKESGSVSPDRRSGYTGSEKSYNYRKYIEELRNLLEMERSKRIQVELKLKQLS